MTDEIELPDSADVVVIGGGINGTSTTYHLAKRGVTDVVLVERDHWAAGTTNCAAGFVVQQYPDVQGIRRSMETNRVLAELAQRREDFAFEQPGLLLTEATDLGRERLREQVELQNELGLPSRFLEPEEVEAVHPHVRTDDLTAATFCPTSGYYDAYSAAARFAEEAEKLGATLAPGTEVLDVSTRDGRVEAVTTDAGTIETPTVVNATGMWGNRIAEMVGLELPIVGLRHQGFTTEMVPELEGRPMVEDYTAAFWFGTDPGGGISMGTFRDDPEVFDLSDLRPSASSDMPSLDRSALTEYLLPDVVHRIPPMENARLRHEWSGVTCFTPDRAPILGEHPDVGGFVNQLGFSAHGITHGPSSGKQIAELIVDGEPSIDLDSYWIERFDGSDVALTKELYTEYFDREKVR